PGDLQIVVVNTSPPESAHTKTLRGLVNQIAGAPEGPYACSVKFVQYEGPLGTTEPRNRVFEESDAEYTVCMDSHVVLGINRLKRLLQWFEANPDCQDLIHGPIIYDNLHAIQSQFSDEMRGGMWGTWATVWEAPDGTRFV